MKLLTRIEEMKTKIFNLIFLKLTPGWFVEFEITFKLYCWLAAMGYEDKPEEDDSSEQPF